MQRLVDTLCPTILIVALMGGCQNANSRSDLERRYDQVKLNMTQDQVKSIMGDGREVTRAEIEKYPEYPKFDTTDFPKATKWMQWDGKLQYVLAGFSEGKLVVIRLVGAQAPKR